MWCGCFLLPLCSSVGRTTSLQLPVTKYVVLLSTVLIPVLHLLFKQLSTSLKVNIDSWNILTTHWLRHSVYERVSPAIGTWVVFMVSAFWHGFYPGYYIAFLSAALFTTAARKVRVIFSWLLFQYFVCFLKQRLEYWKKKRSIFGKKV